MEGERGGGDLPSPGVVKTGPVREEAEALVREREQMAAENRRLRRLAVCRPLQRPNRVLRRGFMCM